MNAEDHSPEGMGFMEAMSRSMEDHCVGQRRRGDGPFIVRLAGNYGLKFHLRGFTAVADQEATRFETLPAAQAAIRACRRFGLNEVNSTIVPMGTSCE
jgi:hypothetical protein